MNIISRKELRFLVEGECLNGRLKNKLKQDLHKIFGVTFAQFSNYTLSGRASEEVVKKLGQYFGKTVDNEKHKPASTDIDIRKPKADINARERNRDKPDMALVISRRGIEEHQARLKAEREYWA